MNLSHVERAVNPPSSVAKLVPFIFAVTVLAVQPTSILYQVSRESAEESEPF